MFTGKNSHLSYLPAEWRSEASTKDVDQRLRPGVVRPLLPGVACRVLHIRLEKLFPSFYVTENVHNWDAHEKFQFVF